MLYKDTFNLAIFENIFRVHVTGRKQKYQPYNREVLTLYR